MLNLGGANYLTLVFLNGIPLGGHRGGSTPFYAGHHGGPAPRPNRLQIMVENRRSPLRVPMQHIDWFNYGGLYRDVALMRLPAIAIRQATAALTPDGRSITATITLDQPVDLMAGSAFPRSA